MTKPDDTTWRPPTKGEYAYGTNECGLLAWWRECYHPGENKGTYSPGRGYTSYHKVPIKVCGTRYFHGCPVECAVPETQRNGEVIRVCQRPDPDWAAARDAIRGLKGRERERYTNALIDELIKAVAKWRGLYEEGKK